MPPQQSQPRKSLRFAETVDPGETVTLTTDVRQDATIEELRVRFYQGPRLDLHVHPFIESDGDRFPLILYRGKQFIDGDSDYFRFPVSEEIAEDDVVGVRVVNNASYAYDFATDYLLDEQGGTARSLWSAIQEVFA